MSLKTRLLNCVLPLAVAFPLHAALAQPAEDPAIPVTEAPVASDAEIVTVTARRFEERLQDVPVAVSAFSEKALNQMAAENIGALQGAVPNLSIVQGRGSNSSANIFIRGVGQPDALATFDPAIGVYVDDVYISRIRGALFDIFDIERIEVLRGPQGTLYGKNTIGGALKIVTRRPSDVFEASLFAGYGDYESKEAKLRLSGPITDDLAFSLAGYYAQRDGYVTDPARHLEYNDKDTVAVRGSLYWTPREDIDVIVNVDYTQENPALSVGKPENTLFRTNFCVLSPGCVAIVPLFVPTGAEYDFRGRTTPGLPNGDNRLDHSGVGVTVNWDVSESWSVKSVTAARNLENTDYVDIDATQFELGDVFVDVGQTQLSQEIQVNYDAGGALRFVGGVFAMREDLSSNQLAFADDLFSLTVFGVTSPVSFTRVVHDTQEMQSLAAYGSLDIDLFDTWMLSLGTRITREHKDYERFTTTISNVGTLNNLAFAFSGEETWVDISPAVTLNWKPSDDAMFYGRIAQGFKSGGFNGRANGALEPRIFDPETLTSYEVGAKTMWLDDRLIANVALFYNDYKDFQARVAAGDSLTTTFGVINAGALEQYGAELEVFFRATSALQLQASVGYLHAEYAEFIDPRSVGFEDRSWQTPAFSPEWTARFGGLYTFDLGASGFIDLSGEASFKGEHALAVDNANLITRVRFAGMFQEEYWLYNARIAWRDASDHYTIALVAKNLGDEVYRTDAQEFSSVGGIRTTYFGAPQTWMITVGVDF